MFDGDWKKQKMSEQDYMKAFSAADERYTQILTALLAQLKKILASWYNGHAGVNGLHHITAIAGPAQENLDFYAGVLGMRLVKRSVNQDDPGTYHLFYADAEGHPGTDLTFFPWAQMAPPRAGHGLAIEVALEVPAGQPRLLGRAARAATARTLGAVETRFGERVLPLVDPHGLQRGARRERRAGAAVHAVGRQPGAGRAPDSRPVRRAALGARRAADRASS